MRPRDRFGRYIRDARDIEGVQQARSYRVWMQTLVYQRYKGLRIAFNNPTGEVYAEIYRGLWIVRCPFCSGAQPAQDGEVFFCVDCVMVLNDGHPMGVIFPDKKTQDQIARALLVRPDVANMNYIPTPPQSDDVAKLESENTQHGLPRRIQG